MKRLTTMFCLAVSLLFASPQTSFADPGPATEKNVEARATILYDRLKEIKTMDHSSLSREEKKELRKEVRAIKKEMKDLGKGVYLSVGAIIIILLLLILILK